ncbi:MAG TPA: glycosyl hydrolase family 79 C-terminal domain-containing protein [Solirubrobacteraceae bacterium]|nr:glycosyl hydrolase family 79 C-terminal domain-containing protein [Solirubrobacteraceae bacterium]
MRTSSHAVVRFLVLPLLALVLGAPVAACGSSAARGTGTSTLVVGSTPVTQAIPPGFVGLSFGYKAFPLYAGTDPNAIDPVFEQLIRNLAPGQSPVLRVAGGDQTWWPIPHARRPAGVNYTLTSGFLRVARALARAVDARLILGVNFEADSARLAGVEGQALVDQIGSKWIDGLELGNEPELYAGYPWYVPPGGHGVYGRPRSWSFSDFVQDFANISRSLPRRVTLAGPAIGSLGWISRLGQFLAGDPRLGMVTLHRYPLKHCSATPETVAELLSSASTTGLAQSVAHDVVISHARHIPVRIGEMNSVSCGGMPGVSNSFASALWSLDALFAMARVNVDGVNMQTARDSLNELFYISRVRGRWEAQVHPIYYGLMMFAQAVPAGSRLLALSGTAGTNVNAWATRAPDGELHVVLINHDTHAHTVSVRIPGRASSTAGPATLTRLQATSVHAESGVTFGGESFGSETDSGLLVGTPSTTSLTPAGDDYVITLPEASAAMLTLPAA